MTEIVWEDPPRREQTTRAKKWFPVLEPMMSEPGRWARIFTADSASKASNLATNMRGGRTQIPPGRWEFMSRKIDERTHGVWARYLGPDE